MARPQDGHFYTRYPAKVTTVLVTLQMTALGIRRRLRPESRTAQVPGSSYTMDRNWEAWTKPLSQVTHSF